MADCSQLFLTLRKRLVAADFRQHMKFVAKPCSQVAPLGQCSWIANMSCEGGRVVSYARQREFDSTCVVKEMLLVR